MFVPDPPPDAGAESEIPTPWAVNCPRDGLVYLSAENYTLQLSRPDDRWLCPRCGATSEWDDDTYDAAMGEFRGGVGAGDDGDT